MIAVKEYFELCKPRVVAMMLITAIVGMWLASPGFIPLNILVFGTLGIGLSAGAAAVINHLVDRHIDSLMNRTMRRPIASGKVRPIPAFIFAVVLACAGMIILVKFVNTTTAIWTLATLLGYAVVYTMFLKRATPQNIVIGGAAGAAPPMLGWMAVTGNLDPYSLLLVLIIFVWTPPHFWALAIYRYQEYEKANIPMLPVTHGIEFTKLCIVLYTILLIAVSLLPFVTGMSGWIYAVGSLLLGLRFLVWAEMLRRHSEMKIAMQTFRFSIVYLLLIFVLLLVDHSILRS